MKLFFSDGTSAYTIKLNNEYALGYNRESEKEYVVSTDELNRIKIGPLPKKMHVLIRNPLSKREEKIVTWEVVKIEI